MTTDENSSSQADAELREKLEHLESFRFHTAGCYATYPEGKCNCRVVSDMDTIMELFRAEVRRVNMAAYKRGIDVGGAITRQAWGEGKDYKGMLEAVDKFVAELEAGSGEGGKS